MTKVDSLKALVSKMTGQDISEVNGETVCDILDQIVEAYTAPDDGEATTIQSMEFVFPVMHVDGVGEVLVAQDGLMTISLKLTNGKSVPATIDFVEV